MKNSFTLLVLAGLLALTQAVPAQSFHLLHTFEGSDGSVPSALTMDRSGNLYGTSVAGGSCSYEYGCGTTFELSHNDSGWVFRTLYEFQGEADGWFPIGPPTIGSGGLLYGTTSDSDLNGRSWGSVYRLTPTCSDVGCNQVAWKKTILYRFDCNQTVLNGGLLLDHIGDLYGTTTLQCGPGQVFELSPAQVLNGTWNKTVLHVFQGPPNDGDWPEGSVLLGPGGSLYGTTFYGGNAGPIYAGTVYELTPQVGEWTESLLYNFKGIDGAGPVGNLILDQSGKLYGVTSSTGFGTTAFQLTFSAGKWSMTRIYHFLPGQAQGTSALVMDTAGNLYGAGAGGGVYGQGTIYKLTPAGDGWVYSTVYDFTGGSDGSDPQGADTSIAAGPLVLDASGNLYGTAARGGDLKCNSGFSGAGCGTVWMITPK